MTFDIHQLDDVDPGGDEAEAALEAYQDALLERFFASPEGQARHEADPDTGFWTEQFLFYGFAYLGAALPYVTLSDAREIVTELFPRKITILSPEEADAAIPELIAFWLYLKREYQLPNADAILRFLRKIEPDFKDVMNDPARFGMAKSFFMMGQSSGFDMTSQEGLDAFMQAYNADLANREADLGSLPGAAGMPGLLPGLPGASRPPKATPKKKKARKKMAKASRKKNRKKRK